VYIIINCASQLYKERVAVTKSPREHERLLAADIAMLRMKIESHQKKLPEEMTLDEFRQRMNSYTTETLCGVDMSMSVADVA
jgi:hypothetical protein